MATKSRINVINKSIRSYYNSIQSNKVRKAVFPGNIQSLWNTVRLAKDSNIDRSPKTLFREGVEIESESICDE